jgi:hypothetical protein
VTRLPQPLSHVQVPRTFSPSQLAFGRHCLLRAVLGSTRQASALTSHPAAAIGSAFHRLIEMAVRGDVQRQGTVADDTERTLEQLLESEAARLSKLWPTSVPDLRSILPPLVWRRKRRVVLDLAQSYVAGRIPAPQAAAVDRPRSPESLPSTGCWSEVKMSVPELRLAGRADLVERELGQVTIRDLKTGRVVSDDSTMLPHIEVQMRLYGLMARRLWPEAQIRLVVDDGTERDVPFQRTDEEDSASWLDAVLARLPIDDSVVAESLATTGEACEGCPYRHLCSAYRRDAPEFWRTETSFRLPLDTWGDVANISPCGNAACDVTLMDAADRMVKVFGLLGARLSGLRQGDRLWLFGLRTRDRRDGPDRWRHPRNFFEFTDDDAFARAWTLETFAEPTDVAPRSL